MEIVVIVLALALLQIWSGKNPLHHDAWFYRWSRWIHSEKKPFSELSSFISVALPLVVFMGIYEVAVRESIWLALPIAVLTLLYSFGRGRFLEIVREYSHACQLDNWETARAQAITLNIDVDDVQENDWNLMHRRFFAEVAYRGFERLFAVLFWFFLLGPVGAVMYRLVFLQRYELGAEDALMCRWLWLLEWPAVRILGLSFALTGNFGGSVSRIDDSVLALLRPTRDVLTAAVFGAFSVEDEDQQSSEVTRRELSLLARLYQRTLWLWVAVMAFIIIFV